MGAAQSGSDPGQLRERLAGARGYAVLGRDGRRVGAFIELAGPNGERIAIRRDGVFLWRRRVLPITTVANVFPKERAVLLNIDRHTLDSTTAPGDAVVGPSLPADEDADPSRELHERIERYISPGESQPEQANADAASIPSAETRGWNAAQRMPLLNRRPSMSQAMSAAPHATCCSSRPRAATCSSSWTVRLRPSGRRSRYRKSRVLSSSPSSVHHRFRTIRGSAPTSSKPRQRHAQSVPKPIRTVLNHVVPDEPNRLAKPPHTTHRQRQATAVQHLGRRRTSA